MALLVGSILVIFVYFFWVVDSKAMEARSASRRRARCEPEACAASAAEVPSAEPVAPPVLAEAPAVETAEVVEPPVAAESAPEPEPLAVAEPEPVPAAEPAPAPEPVADPAQEPEPVQQCAAEPEPQPAPDLGAEPVEQLAAPAEEAAPAAQEEPAPDRAADDRRAGKLIKEAASLQAKKDFDAAIALLREAYDLMERAATISPIDNYLKLPQYLEKAGRFGEAATEYEALLAGAPARVAREHDELEGEKAKGFVAMERRAIYKAMQPAYRKADRLEEAILFGLLEHASWCAGLQYKKRGQELRSARSMKAWKEVTDSVFGRSSLADRKEAALAACIEFAKECDEKALAALEKALRDLILG
jgi:outer membrane biosynthesis protein TonB